MEAAESPLDVLSRAAVMLQRNVLPPPSYDEARSLSQQQTQTTQRKNKVITNDMTVMSSVSPLSYDQTNASGKWKREKKHQQKTTVVASTCDSSHNNDYKSNTSYNGKCITENSSEPLDMSKRTATKDRGEPPSYFQSILSSNYAHRQSNVPSVYNSNDEASNTSSSSNEDKEAMCDQVINEHFRRSLGQDYVNVFSTNKKNENEVITDNQTVVSKLSKDEKLEKNSTRHVSPSPLSVDDHFAKALGDTWIRLQQQEKRQSNQNTSTRTAYED